MSEASILDVDANAIDGLLALNNAHAEDLSELDLPRFRHLLQEAFWSARIGEADALLLAFDQDADYDSENFHWFKTQLARFVYVDRVVVAATARGRGHGARLYVALFAKARAAGHSRIVCEVNSVPANPASDRFHARMGFREIGNATLSNGRKRVRYFVKELGTPSTDAQPR